MRRMLRLLLALLLTAVALGSSIAGQAITDPPPTTIYFVRHGAVDITAPDVPLSAAGRQQAGVFARTVKDVRFTHILSSHTTRARQMVEPVAQAQGLAVRAMPEPGSTVDGAVVTGDTSSRIAIAPLVTALRALPNGSRALVGVNADNIYPLLNGLGVPVATAEQPCTLGATCVPCLANTCFPGGDDQLWILVLGTRSSAPTLMELRYGIK
jgi:hypothetical protein